MLWDIVDGAKQAVDPLTHLIQALNHLDKPIFGFAKTSDTSRYNDRLKLTKFYEGQQYNCDSIFVTKVIQKYTQEIGLISYTTI